MPTCLTTSQITLYFQIPTPSVNFETNAVQGSCTGEWQHLSQAGQPDRQNDRFNCRTSKVVTQAKLTSMYGSKPFKLNNGLYKSMLNSKNTSMEECIAVDKMQNYNQNHHKGLRSLQVEDEEKPQRPHVAITSPRSENLKSPTCNEDTEGPGNAFVTARAKLVYIWLLTV